MGIRDRPTSPRSPWQNGYAERLIGSSRDDRIPNPSPFSDCDLVVCYGAAKLTDKHLASKVHRVDDEIIGWLKRRETKPRGLRGQDIEQNHLI
jgi:transposase InsO family protein